MSLIFDCYETAVTKMDGLFNPCMLFSPHPFICLLFSTAKPVSPERSRKEKSRFSFHVKQNVRDLGVIVCVIQLISCIDPYSQYDIYPLWFLYFVVYNVTVLLLWMAATFAYGTIASAFLVLHRDVPQLYKWMCVGAVLSSFVASNICAILYFFITDDFWVDGFCALWFAFAEFVLALGFIISTTFLQ